MISIVARIMSIRVEKQSPSPCLTGTHLAMPWQLLLLSVGIKTLIHTLYFFSFLRPVLRVHLDFRVKYVVWAQLKQKIYSVYRSQTK